MVNMMDFHTDINQCINVLKKGGIILYPTDTIWGIGCDATNEDAVNKIFALKRREKAMSMIVLTDSIAGVERLTGEIPEAAEQLIEAAVNPLTIIYDNASGVAKSVKAADGSLAIRITQERFSKELCKRFRRPIVSTSANISGSKSARNFIQISDEIKSGVDYIVKYRQDDNRTCKASNIIKVTGSNEIKIIR